MEYDAVKIFKALSNPSRLAILQAIYKEGICGTYEGCSPSVESCSCVGDIVERFDLAPSTISHHIRELALAGLIEVTRDGQFVRISPNPEALKEITGFADLLIGEVAGT